MKKIIIIGSGGHAKIIYQEIHKLNKLKFIGFIDEIKKKKTLIKKIKSKKLTVLGNINYLKKIYDNKTYLIIGIGNNFIREHVVRQIEKKIKFVKWATVISKDSIISKDVTIGIGSIVVSGSVINTETKIGKHCIINTKSLIEHNNLIENYASCGPSTVTGGNVTIKKNAFIGIRSTIKNNITIGKNVIIGANSLVLKNCIQNYIYYGRPAKKIKKINTKKSYL
jgi:sugar O-acyltransferase (sialic acid O-acetyltransferase NeuD family)